MSNKKTLYEILEVPADATHTEIRASHERLLQSLESRQSALSREDYTTQLRLLKVAYSTLSTPTSRDSYDAHLTIRNAPARPSSALLVTTPAANGSTGVMRADALMMRAEAIALRADALGLKADLLSGTSQGSGDTTGSPIVSRLLSSLKSVLLTLGTVAALVMVFKVVMLMTLSRQPDGAGGARGQTDDKVYLQEYYQTHGVRPASRVEAELMDAERRKNEDARRAQKMIDDKERSAAQDERKFEEAARRRAEQVSTELQYAEEKARRAQLQEAREREYEIRQQEEAERLRIESLRAKWKNDLRSSGNY